MINILLVGLGGCLGSILRFLTMGMALRLYPNAVFPWGTLIVNIVGCFIIGFLAGMGATKQFLTAPLRLFLFTGILGGFTTFSAFGLESFMLLKGEHWFLGVVNIAGQVFLGVIMVGVGNKIAMMCS